MRRAFLCSDSVEYRRAWVEDKLLALAEVFCIDVDAYAVMSNHYHVVLHINTKEAKQLSIRGVIERWHQLFKGNLLSQCYSRSENLIKAEREALTRSSTPGVSAWVISVGLYA